MLDHLLVRRPGLVRLMTGGIRRIPVGSSLRERMITLQVKRGFAAMARSDVDVVVLSYEPQAEVWMRSMAGVGISDCYRGHQGVRDLYADVDDAFDHWWWTIRRVADAGDGIVVGGDFVGYGRSSGVKTVLKDGGTAIRFSPRGLIAWQEWFVVENGWEPAIAAVGLRPPGA